MRKEERYARILAHFREQMPNVNTELEFGSVFQLLVAVILSAQCTDKRINQVTPELFRHYPDAKTMAKAEPEDVLDYISSVSYPNAKADHLVKMARALVEKHDGEVPSDMNALLDLPGVGRKTANVIQSVAFGKSTLAVDTHVYRVAHRLGLVSKSDNTPYNCCCTAVMYAPRGSHTVRNVSWRDYAQNILKDRNWPDAYFRSDLCWLDQFLKARRWKRSSAAITSHTFDAGRTEKNLL